jgi:hypothetical protein
MFRYTRRLALSLTILLAFSVGACRGTGDDDQLAQDTALNRDLELANRDTAAQPALTDVPATGTPAPTTSAPARATTTTRRTTTPARTTPAPRATTPGNVVTRTPATAERRTGMIPAGTSLAVTSGTRVCTNTHQVGQTFQATVANTVTGSNGSAIPAGATATVEITELRRSNNVNEPVVVGLRVRSVSFGGRTYPVSATTASANVETISTATGRRTARNVATGAAVGAIIGQVLGRDTRATVAGAAVGAAAGAAGAAATANAEGCVPVGGRITVTLNSALSVVV